MEWITPWKEWSTYCLKHGLFITATSSSFAPYDSDAFRDGDAMMYSYRITPFSSSEMNLMMAHVRNQHLLPMILSNKDIVMKTGRIPRMLSFLLHALKNNPGSKWHEFERLANEYYASRVRKLLKKHASATDYEFALQVFRNDDIEHPSPMWKNSGLLVEADPNKFLPICPSASQAIAQYRESLTLNIINSHT